MITFTQLAISHIKNILSQHPAGAMFRLSVKETGCSGYMYIPEIVQEIKAGDITLPITEITVLIDPACVSLIQGTVVDYVKKNLGASQLCFENPNAKGLCGCGESFTLSNQHRS